MYIYYIIFHTTYWLNNETARSSNNMIACDMSHYCRVKPGTQ